MIIITLLKRLKRTLTFKIRFFIEWMGYSVSKTSDYYSPLPVESQLKKNVNRWNKPSSMHAISFSVDTMKANFSRLTQVFLDEFLSLEPYNVLQKKGFGPGYPHVDALTLYMMVRQLKPKRYIEVGSGLSTYYCSLAGNKNKSENNPLHITCIEPNPYKALQSIDGISLIQDSVQNVGSECFQTLEKNDILFIDSSHIVKLDGDVPYLYLEILPLIQKGVFIHIHDIPFPFNIPYPAKLWVFDKNWPMYWNEAMLLQALLMYNTTFNIHISTPLLRYYDEPFLNATIPFYQSIEECPNTFSSLWLEKQQ